MCFRYLEFTSFRQVDLLDYRECRIIEDAVRLRQVDKSYAAHLTAWLTMAAKARRRSGSLVYKKFIQFFNFEKQEKDVLESQKEEGVGKLPGLANYYREKRRKKKETQ